MTGESATIASLRSIQFRPGKLSPVSVHRERWHHVVNSNGGISQPNDSAGRTFRKGHGSAWLFVSEAMPRSIEDSRRHLDARFVQKGPSAPRHTL